MATIRNFLKKHGNTSFKDLPFCEAEVICLCLLSYCNYEQSKLMKEKQLEHNFILLSEFLNKETKKVITDNFLRPDTFMTFLESFIKSPRYKDVQIGFIEEKSSDHNEIQFCGMTFIIDDKYYVVFRGTDRKVVGWKEDFNLCLLDEIPSQNEAKHYLAKIVNLLDKDVYIVGHSKGGNLAYYSFYNVDEYIKDRVLKVYNLDGPGFSYDTTDVYNKYKNKLVKIVPHDDVVGILLDDPSELTVCNSNELNVNAHDPLSWQLDYFSNYKNFSLNKELSIYSETLRITIREFIIEIGRDKVEDVKAAIFEIIQINKVCDVINILDAAFTNIVKVLNKYKKENKEKAEEMENLIKIFIKNYVVNYSKVQESRRTTVFQKFYDLKEKLK